MNLADWQKFSPDEEAKIQGNRVKAIALVFCWPQSPAAASAALAFAPLCVF
jgi:hypothetical protein